MHFYMHFSKEQNQKFIFKQISCILTCIIKKNHISFVNAFFKKQKKEKFMHFHASNIHLPIRKNQTSCKSTDIIKEKDSMYFRILKHDGIILLTLSRDLMKVHDLLLHGLRFRYMTL